MAEANPTSITLKPKQLAALLAAAIPSGKPVLVVGGPGTAKTAIITDTARALKYDLILSHPAIEDATDPAGIPWYDQDAKMMRRMPVGQLARVLRAKKPTVWFIDDLGQGHESVQKAYMQWLHGGELGGNRLPECVSIIAATNRRTDRAGVAGLLEPVKSRFVTIVELAPDLDEWVQWAFGHDVEPVVIAWAKFKGFVYDFKPTADLVNSLCPRTLEHVSDLVKLGLPNHIEAVAVSGAIGQGYGLEFSAFRKTWADMPDVDAILLNPDAAPIPTKPDVLISVATALAFRANKRNCDNYVKYCERLAQAERGEVAAFSLNAALAKDPSMLSGSVAWTRAIGAGELGKLLAREEDRPASVSKKGK